PPCRAKWSATEQPTTPAPTMMMSAVLAMPQLPRARPVPPSSQPATTIRLQILPTSSSLVENRLDQPQEGVGSKGLLDETGGPEIHSLRKGGLLGKGVTTNPQ